MNITLLIGNLVRDVELRYTKNDLAVGKFTIAVKRDTKETDFISCVAYGKQAETISKFLSKGSTVAIEGRIQTGSYEKDGKKVYTTDVIVNKITFINTKKKEETKEETQTEIVQKAMSDNPYENMGQQVQMDNEGLPF